MTDRQHGEGLLARALQIVVDASPNKTERDYTDDELEELMFCLTMAWVQFKKLPGGQEAAERVYENVKAEQDRRRVH